MFCSVYSLVIVLFYVLFVCKCVLRYSYRVSTQLQLTNTGISYHIISYHIISYHIISYHIIYHIISYHISCHVIYIISCHIISYIISYHTIYHIISYHIICHINITGIMYLFTFTSHMRVYDVILSRRSASTCTCEYVLESVWFIGKEKCFRTVCRLQCLVLHERNVQRIFDTLVNFRV